VSRIRLVASAAALVVAALAAGEAAAQVPAAITQSTAAPADYRPPKKRVSPFSAYADAQKNTNPLAKKPTPRTADGHPDLSGMWAGIPSAGGIGGIRQDGAFEPDQSALQRASGWDKPIYKPEYWDKVHAFDYGRADVDPAFACGIPGVPRQNVPNRIIQFPTEMMMFGFGRVRSIPTDGRKLTPEDMDNATFDGISVGRWEGDTFIVDSVGFNNITWLQWQGYFHTDQMKVTERFWREGDLLFYNFTVDDPDVLVEPWTQGTYVVRKVPFGGRMGENGYCLPGPPEGDLYMRG
jgi:hypothetical protein